MIGKDFDPATRFQGKGPEWPAQIDPSSFLFSGGEAFRDVESALANEIYLLDQRDRLAEAVSESGSAERLAWDKYQSGTADITTVLDAERRAFEARSFHIETQSAYLIKRVDLYLALGGDFEMEKDAPAEVSK